MIKKGHSKTNSRQALSKILFIIFSPLFVAGIAMIAMGFALITSSGAVYDDQIRATIKDVVMKLIITGISIALGARPSTSRLGIILLGATVASLVNNFYFSSP